MKRLFKTITILVLIRMASVMTVKTGVIKGKTSYGMMRRVYTSLTREQEEKVMNYVDDRTDSYRVREAIRYSLSRLGDEYSQPKRFCEGYADCSSLVYSAYLAGGINIANGDMTYASAIYQGIEKYKVEISGKKDLKAGDIIFYGGNDNGRYLGIYHVALYVGDGMMVDATVSVGCVSFRPVKLRSNCYVCRIG